MYVHLGNNCNVRSKNILAVLDMDTSTLSKITREFFATAEEEGFINLVSADLPKSAVICEVGHESKVFLCPVASSTIRKRIKMGGFTDEQ